MYKTYRYESTINIWCDGRMEGAPEVSRANRWNSGDSTSCSKSVKREEEIHSIFERLRDRHSENYSDSQLKLWAHMQVNGHRNDLDSPPMYQTLLVSLSTNIKESSH